MNPTQSPGPAYTLALGQKHHLGWMGRYLHEYLLQQGRTDRCPLRMVLQNDRNSTEYKKVEVPGVRTAVCMSARSLHSTQYLARAWFRQARARYPSSSPKHELRLEGEGSPPGHAGPVKPSAQLQLSTSINLHSLFGAASPPGLCLVLSCLFSCRVKLVLCQCQLEKRDHNVPVPVPVPTPHAACSFLLPGHCAAARRVCVLCL